MMQPYKVVSCTAPSIGELNRLDKVKPEVGLFYGPHKVFFGRGRASCWAEEGVVFYWLFYGIEEVFAYSIARDVCAHCFGAGFGCLVQSFLRQPRPALSRERFDIRQFFSSAKRTPEC